MVVYLGIFLSLLAQFSSTALGSSCDSLIDDPGFHWIVAPDFQLHRKPPDLFGSQLSTLVTSTIRELPKGLSPEEFSFLNGIFQVLRDLNRVEMLLKMTEEDIRKKTSTNGHSDELNYLNLLSEFESEQKIGVERINHPLTDDELLAVVARGSTFVDTVGDFIGATLGPGREARPGHWIHWLSAHRLQLHLILRDFKLRPEFYGGLKNFKAAYQKIGSQKLHARLDWSSTGDIPKTLFFYLFDSLENNASSPGFFSEYHKYWPLIPPI